MKLKDSQKILFCSKCNCYTIHEFGHDEYMCLKCDLEISKFVDKAVKKEKKILRFLIDVFGKRRKENLKQYFMKIGCYVLGVSALLDLALWFLTGYLVPSWTIAVMSLICIYFIWILRGKMK